MPQHKFFPSSPTTFSTHSSKNGVSSLFEFEMLEYIAAITYSHWDLATCSNPNGDTS